MTRFEHFSATIPHAQSVMIGAALWDGENVTYAYQARQQAHRETMQWHAERRVLADLGFPGRFMCDAWNPERVSRALTVFPRLSRL